MTDGQPMGGQPRGMARRTRLLLFAVAALCAMPGAVHVARHMPRFGDHPLPYGDAINAAAPAERHVTNTVSAVNFDYRGFDTLGEEFMLLCAVTGVTVLLRGPRGETTDQPGAAPGRPVLPRTDAIVLAVRLSAACCLLFGLYVALHATTTPGGGFQGGVIIASGVLCVFLGDGYRAWRRLVRSELADAAEGLGAALYAACGFAGLLAGTAFGENILPCGKLKDLFSGGLMVVENAGVALAVAGGFTIVFIEFLEETRVVPEGG